MPENYEKQLECARVAAETAAALLRRAFHYGENGVDKAAEEEIRKTLMGAFPEYGYRGEELGLIMRPHDASGHLWLVDPDDGTSAFEQGFRGASVSIALLRQGRPVLGVVNSYCAPDDDGDWFAWAEGTGPVTRNGRPSEVLGDAVPQTVLVSHQADCNSDANAKLVAPMRFRTVPSIAYRLALVAAGEARAAVSLNGPVGWDYAGGHALLLGAGMDLYSAKGDTVRYDRDGNSSCDGACFGGPADIALELARRDWSAVRRRSRGPQERYSLCRPERGRTVCDARRLARAQGCLLSQLAGDALGGLVEFRPAASIRAEYPNGVRVLHDGGCWGTIAGQPTDDSEMALALARSIVANGGYEMEAASRAYAWWYQSGPYDIGATTRAAVSAACAAAKAVSFRQECVTGWEAVSSASSATI
jgi:fructose-1,6-bisphosphatase/inositol monophosphatase family enzyme